MGIPAIRAIDTRWRDINEWLASMGETQAVWGEYRAHALSDATESDVARAIVAARKAVRTCAGAWCVAVRRSDDVRLDDPQWQATQTAECEDESFELAFPDGSMAHSAPSTGHEWREGALPLVPVYLTQSQARMVIRALNGMVAPRGFDDAEALADVVRANLAAVVAPRDSAA